MTREATPMQDTDADITLGLRLRRAREARQWSAAQVAERLHMPVAIVEAMEREDMDRLGAPIYVRGNYSSYVRLLDLPQALVARFCQMQDTAELPLTPGTHTPRSRILFDRYAKRAAYVVLTASIVPSIIWLASIDRSDARIQTLLESSAQRDEGADPMRVATTRLSLAGESSDVSPLPVKASMAPSYGLASRPPVEPAAENAAPVAEAAAASPTRAELVLQFVEDSWVEVVAQDGTRLESGILRAGSERRFDATAVSRVSLGNSGGVRAELRGEAVDLTPFRRANVARFALSSDGSVTGVGG
jgi:cytoskeleton protein RodZ